MNNTEKILEEFDEMFPNLGAADFEEGWYDAKPEVKAFLATSIAQARAEERERMRAKTKGVRDSLLVYFRCQNDNQLALQVRLRKVRLDKVRLGKVIPDARKSSRDGFNLTD